MVFTVEMNKDTSPTSLADTESEAGSIKQNCDGSKSRKVCCQVMWVVIGLILIATILPLSICSSKHYKSSGRETIEICWDQFLASVRPIRTKAGCRVNGENGDGTKRGTCNEGEFCYANGNCHVEKTTEYVYAEERERTCSGRRLGFGTSSLQAARTYCNSKKECSCIYDTNCDGSLWHMYSGQPTASNSDCSWTKHCSNSDGIVGFYYSHSGYWDHGYISMGSQTITECAKTCIQGCVAFNRHSKTCYHYFKRSDIVNDSKVKQSSDNKAYIKCVGT